MQIQFQSAFVALERVLALHELVSEDDHDKNKTAINRLYGSVKFEDISFAYSTGKSVLNKISFSAEPGEMIAIVGPTGAGKSTLINLILRLYEPQKGVILFDGIKSTDIQKKISPRKNWNCLSGNIFIQ